VIQRGWLSISPVTISERSFIYRISAFVLLSRAVIPTVVFAASRDSSFASRDSSGSSSRPSMLPPACCGSSGLSRFRSYQNPNKDVNARVIGLARPTRNKDYSRHLPDFRQMFIPCAFADVDSGTLIAEHDNKVASLISVATRKCIYFNAFRARCFDKSDSPLALITRQLYRHVTLSRPA